MSISSTLRLTTSALVVCGGFALLGACSSSNQVGSARSEPGPMGTTATPSQADLPNSNSQSSPIMKPQ